MAYRPVKPIRFEVKGGALVAQPFEYVWPRDAYVDPILDPPPARLWLEEGASGVMVESLEELGAVLVQRGLRLAQEARGRERELAEWLLLASGAANPFWSYRFSMYQPGEFEAAFGVSPEGGRARLVGNALVFWTIGNLLKPHLPGIQELRWDLRSLAFTARQLSTLRRR